jgi:hypothetical protein
MLRFALIACATLAGCTGTYSSGYGGGYASATVSSPPLAYVGPDVYVVADYDYPVFYTDNYYWRYDRGRWLRSHRHNAGWTVYSRPPRALYSIREPNRYVRYRPDRRNITYRDRIDRRRYRR